MWHSKVFVYAYVQQGKVRILGCSKRNAIVIYKKKDTKQS